MMTDRHIIPVFLAATILLCVLIFAIIGYVIIHRRKQQETDLEIAEIEFQHTTNLLKARLEEQEIVMTQISKELHDNVAQKIDLLHMTIKDMDNASPNHFFKLHLNSKAILVSITNDLRNISYSLDGSYIIQNGLDAVLARELSYIRDSRNIDCQITVNGVESMLPEGTELLVYRIAQEVLHNALKHAKPTNIMILLNYLPGRFIMQVNDNGIGFDAANVQSSNGLGLKNMHQRASLLGAILQVVSSPQQGCSVQLDFCYQE